MDGKTKNLQFGQYKTTEKLLLTLTKSDKMTLTEKCFQPNLSSKNAIFFLNKNNQYTK